jgi:hypothetical protein
MQAGTVVGELADAVEDEVNNWGGFYGLFCFQLFF